MTPTLGIALGGGGAKGFAHIGALRVFRDAAFEFQVVSGTSIGALVGAAYCADALAALESEARGVHLRDIPQLLSPAWSTGGVFSGENVLELMGRLLSISRIESLPRRFCAVAVDIERSEPVVFTAGDVLQAVRASMAIPGIFTPAIHGKQTLVDGGLLVPVPLAQARALGADILVAIDLFGERPSGRRLATQQALWPREIQTALSYLRSLPRFSSRQTAKQKSLFEVVQGTLFTIQRHLTSAALQESPPDVLLQPPVGDVGLLDFHRADPVIRLGEQAAEAALPALRQCVARYETCR